MTRVDEQRLVDLLIQWNRSQLRGKPVNLEKLCPDDAVLREALRVRIDQLLAIEGTIESINAEDRATSIYRLSGSGEESPSTDHADWIGKKRPILIVPKGLRSFDRRDAHFFRALLPGPWCPDGTPESLAFWLSRINEQHRDKTFSISVLYGPSGSGKSSFIKAGLIPSLPANIDSIYIEASPGETETRLINRLLRRFPEIPGEINLQAILASLTRATHVGTVSQKDEACSEPIPKKTLIVLDQFERWFLENSDPDSWPSSDLVLALRQVDGQSVQCILVVRDDFWVRTTQFLRLLNTRLIDGENANAIDLFPKDHARRVLAAFGHALGALPDDESTLNPEQKEFLHLAIDGLEEQGRVLPARLAIFVDAMKSRTWVPATLGDVVGAEEIGVSYLEARLGSLQAPPDHRRHLKAACAMLKKFVPVAGTDTAIRPLSYSELLNASGYHHRLQEFDDLLRILDNELRLITPSDRSDAAQSHLPSKSGQLGCIADTLADGAGELYKPEGRH